MIFKIIAATLIISVCGYIGFEMSNALKLRVRTLGEFIVSLGSLENYIESIHMPLGEIYKKLSCECEVLKEFYCNLAKSDTDNETAWNREIKTLGLINEADRRILCELSSTLGKCNISTQLTNLRFAKSRLCENLKGAKETFAADAKMYRTVSLFTGIGIAVLLM